MGETKFGRLLNVIFMELAMLPITLFGVFLWVPCKGIAYGITCKSFWIALKFLKYSYYCGWLAIKSNIAYIRG